MVKHFLDSSVAQHLLFGSSAYKRYLEEQFADGDIYISDYVQMEIKRSFFVPCIEFYFLFDSPSIKTLGDAFSQWSNKFSKKDLKAVYHLMSVFNIYELNPTDKPRAVRNLGFLIKGIERELRRKFTNIGVNTTRCARAEVLFISPQLEDSPISEQFKQFVEKFNDTKYCRSQCNVDTFFTRLFKKEVSLFFEQETGLLTSREKRANHGFVAITEHLREIVDTKGKVCTCYKCGFIGDAVIALETPAEMRLEHTDHSFDKLCQAIARPHQKHPPETKFDKND